MSGSVMMFSKNSDGEIPKKEPFVPTRFGETVSPISFCSRYFLEDARMMLSFVGSPQDCLPDEHYLR